MTPTRLAPGHLRLMQCGNEVVITYLDLTVSAAGTEIQRATHPDGPYQTLGTVPAPGSARYRTFADEGSAADPLVVGETYYYRMRSSMYGDAAEWSQPAAVTLTADRTRLVRGGSATFLPGPDGDLSM